MSLVNTLMLKLKLKHPPHVTMHDRTKQMPRPEAPPVTGAYGNVVHRPPRTTSER